MLYRVCVRRARIVFLERKMKITHADGTATQYYSDDFLPADEKEKLRDKYKYVMNITKKRDE